MVFGAPDQQEGLLHSTSLPSACCSVLIAHDRPPPVGNPLVATSNMPQPNIAAISSGVATQGEATGKIFAPLPTTLRQILLDPTDPARLAFVMNNHAAGVLNVANRTVTHFCADTVRVNSPVPTSACWDFEGDSIWLPAFRGPPGLHKVDLSPSSPYVFDNHAVPATIPIEDATPVGWDSKGCLNQGSLHLSLMQHRELLVSAVTDRVSGSVCCSDVRGNIVCLTAQSYG